jgi:hypothetical protein
MAGRARAGVSTPQLRCPVCGVAQPPDERFCPKCGLPLVVGDGEPVADVTARHAWARKIKPQLAEGPLVRVAGAHNQAEGEMLQGLLLEAGVPSLLRRSAGFDVPDFLAAGPRDVMVPQSGAVTAREVLLEAEVLPAGSDPGAAARAPVSPRRLLVGLLIALAVGALVIWLGTLVVG